MLHSTTGLLLAAVAGYWVLERAETHKQGNLRRLGRFLGWVIVIASLVGVASRTCGMASKYCGMKKSTTCPLTGADMSDKSTSQVPSR